MSKQKEERGKSDKTTAAQTPKEKKAMKAFKKQERNQIDHTNI